METITQKLADFISSFHLNNLENEILKKIKIHILDTLAVALKAADTFPVKAFLKAFPLNLKKGNIKVWGRDEKLNLFLSIMANAVAAHTLELDDVHREGKVHPGAVIVPTALSLGEYLHSSGKEVLKAILAGYEVMIRIGIGIGAASHRLKGWHATATCGTFGSATTASILLSLNSTEIVNALGLAGTQSSGLWAFTADGSLSKKFHPARAAESGVLSAFLAKKGFSGPSMIIEADDGGLFRATSDDYNFERILDGLGDNFKLLKTEIKPYACCRSMHPAIEAALKLKGKIKIDLIDSIEVRIFSVAFKQCGFTNHPKNSVEAQFSLPYAVAVALIDGEALIEQFSERRVNRSDVHNLAERVKLVIDNSYDNDYPEKWRSKVILHLLDGNKLSHEIEHAKGSPESPLTEKEIKNRFFSLATSSIPERNAFKLRELIYNLEAVNDVNELTTLL